MINSHVAIKTINKASLFDLSPLDGEIVFSVDTNEIFVATKSGFVQIQSTKEESSKPLRPRICERCGGSMHSNICEYCGTEYW